MTPEDLSLIHEESAQTQAKNAKKKFFVDNDESNIPGIEELSSHADICAKLLAAKIAYDWPKIETEYIATRLSYKQIAFSIFEERLFFWRNDETRAILAEYFSRYHEGYAREKAENELKPRIVALIARRIAHKGARGKWPEQRIGHSARIIKTSLDARAEEEQKKILAMLDKEQADAVEMIAILDKLKATLQKNPTSGYLFESLNLEDDLTRLAALVDNRLKVQKMHHSAHRLGVDINTVGNELFKVPVLPPDEIEQELLRLVESEE